MLPEDGKGLKHLHGKIYWGVAIEVSGGIGNFFNYDNKSCSNPEKGLLGSELGGSYGIDAEGSVTVATGGGDTSGSGGFDIGSDKLDIYVKSTSCYYKIINTIPYDQKCKWDYAHKLYLWLWKQLLSHYLLLTQLFFIFLFTKLLNTQTIKDIKWYTLFLNFLSFYIHALKYEKRSMTSSLDFYFFP